MELIKVELDNINGILVTTSNRVAKELEVEHKSLLRKIDNYVKKFNSAQLCAQFYISSEYKDRSGKTNRNYLITKKGIAQLIGGYSSAVEKAFDLNVAYINKFEEMEKALIEQKQLSLELKYSNNIDDLYYIEKDIRQLKAKANAIKRELLEKRFLIDERIEMLDNTGLTSPMQVYRAKGIVHIIQDA
ncbi:MAG: Rha family transcriptional regulator [Fusobacterium sp.]